MSVLFLYSSRNICLFRINYVIQYRASKIFYSFSLLKFPHIHCYLVRPCYFAILHFLPFYWLTLTSSTVIGIITLSFHLRTVWPFCFCSTYSTIIFWHSFHPVLMPSCVNDFIILTFSKSHILRISNELFSILSNNRFYMRLCHISSIFLYSYPIYTLYYILYPIYTFLVIV